MKLKSKNFNPKRQSAFIFMFLFGILLIGFQNCSSSVYSIAVSRPAKAQTDLSAMLNESEAEIAQTKVNLKNTTSDPNSFQYDLSHRQLASQNPALVANDLERIESGSKSLKIKLKPKMVSKKTKTNGSQKE